MIPKRRPSMGEINGTSSFGSEPAIATGRVPEFQCGRAWKRTRAHGWSTCAPGWVGGAGRKNGTFDVAFLSHSCKPVCIEWWGALFYFGCGAFVSSCHPDALSHLFLPLTDAFWGSCLCPDASLPQISYGSTRFRVFAEIAELQHPASLPGTLQNFSTRPGC